MSKPLELSEALCMLGFATGGLVGLFGGTSEARKEDGLFSNTITINGGGLVGASLGCVLGYGLGRVIETDMYWLFLPSIPFILYKQLK